MTRKLLRLLFITLGCVLVLPVSTGVASIRTPRDFVFLNWDKEVGRFNGDESESQGPKAFALKPDGGILLLDQVDFRIMEFSKDGLFQGEIPVPASTFDDIQQFNGEYIILLDRLVTKTLMVMDFSGKRLLELDLKGKGIDNPGFVTALFSKDDGIWVEVKHHYSVKLLNSNMHPCQRTIILGRPADKGYSIVGALDKKGGVTVSLWNQYDRRNENSIVLKGSMPVKRIVWLDSDSFGNFHAILHEAVYETVSPFELISEDYLIIQLDSDFNEIDRTISKYTLSRYFQKVETRVGSDGTVWQMAFTEFGVQFIYWRVS